MRGVAQKLYPKIGDVIRVAYNGNWIRAEVCGTGSYETRIKNGDKPAVKKSKHFIFVQVEPTNDLLEHNLNDYLKTWCWSHDVAQLPLPNTEDSHK